MGQFKRDIKQHSEGRIWVLLGVLVLASAALTYL
jgi:hypothetical protein